MKLLAGLVALVLLMPIFASAAEDPNALVEKYSASRKEVNEAEAQKRRILGSLYGINQRMKRITHEKSHLTDEMFQAQDNVKSIAKIIANLEGQIQTQRKQLRKRLRALYKLSGEGYMSIVFSRADPQDLDQTMRFLKIITDNDYHLIRAYQENIASYTAQKKKLKGQVEKLLSIEKNIKSKENMLLAEHNAQSKIVSSLDKEKIAHINQMKSLRSKVQDMSIADLMQPSIFEQKGSLDAPAQGSLLQDFGLVTDDKFKIRLAHKGWLYETAKGSPVASIFEGTVIYSEFVKGYGHTIVVDHGDHYYSVYAHISHATAKTGDTIKKGQIIAESGEVALFGDQLKAGESSGQHALKTKDGFYFEIRHFSEPENPAVWIRKGHGNPGNSIATNASGEI